MPANQHPAHDPEIDFWAQRRAEESRRAYLSNYRRKHARAVAANVANWLARCEAAEANNAKQAAA